MYVSNCSRSEVHGHIALGNSKYLNYSYMYSYLAIIIIIAAKSWVDKIAYPTPLAKMGLLHATNFN